MARTVIFVVEVTAVLDGRERLAVACPAGMRNVDGTGNARLLADRVINAPPLAAGRLRPNSMVAAAPLATFPGVIENEFSVGRPAGAEPPGPGEGVVARGVTVIFATLVLPL